MKLYENVIFTQARYPQILPQFPLVFWFLVILRKLLVSPDVQLA